MHRPDDRVAPPVSGPVKLKTKEGKTGWQVVLPGGRPLATPALADGKLLIGGGFGSYEFYAFDAVTGQQLWQCPTNDDGPTAAVVEDGFISFNTESCELYVLDMAGQVLWKKWLGDPLMSMPAISKSRVYMAYPDSRGGGDHRLACFNIRDGAEHWTKPIVGEIITAPVIHNDKIYLTTLEGTMYCFHERDGTLAWSELKYATSSPTVFDGKLYFSQRTESTMKDRNGMDVKQQMECLAGREEGEDCEVLAIAGTQQMADYLDFAKRTARSPMEKKYKAHDGTVGFGAAPAAAKMMQARAHLGHGTVSGIWSYQGSRPFVYKGKLVSTMGDTVKCVDPLSDEVLWQKDLHPQKDGESLLDCVVTPPAVVDDQLFVGTSKGEVVCLSADEGDELWRATVGEPIAFQPAVAKGRVYVASNNGVLSCIETGDANNHGWLMWGGNAQHNGYVM